MISQFAERLFSSREKSEQNINDLMRACKNAKERKSVMQFLYDFIEYVRQKLGKNHKVTLELVKLQNAWANAVKQVGDEYNKTATENGGVKYSVGQTYDGINYVLLDKIDLINKEGKIISGRDFYKSLINTKIKFEDGDVITFVKKLPNVKMYDELFRRYPTYKDVTGIKVINDKVNKNIKEVFETSKLEKSNVPQHHKHIGIENFDNRSVYI